MNTVAKTATERKQEVRIITDKPVKVNGMTHYPVARSTVCNHLVPPGKENEMCGACLDRWCVGY